MEIYANADIASWQGAARLRSITLAPISVARTTGLSAAVSDATVFAGDITTVFAGAGQVKRTAMNHNSTARPGSPPRGRHR